MLTIAPGLKVYLACKPVDMRRGFDGLAADVAQVLRADPYSGAVFIFRSRRGDYLKILAWDGSGLCLFAKRLERGRFVWPPIVDGGLRLTAAQAALLVEGRSLQEAPLSKAEWSCRRRVDWRRTVAPAEVAAPALA